jgi:trans-aconitate methyltransferase
MLSRRPDIAYIPTPQEAVDAMLELAQVRSTDVIYDLGCGDGRVLITAAQRYGIRGVGIEIDVARIQEAQALAEHAQVPDRVAFHHQDLFECDFREATIVFLYLLPHLNLRLRPRLFQQLQPGARIISRDFDMGDWQPQQVLPVQSSDEPCTLYYWKISAELADFRSTR